MTAKKGRRLVWEHRWQHQQQEVAQRRTLHPPSVPECGGGPARSSNVQRHRHQHQQHEVAQRRPPHALLCQNVAVEPCAASSFRRTGSSITEVIRRKWRREATDFTQIETGRGVNQGLIPHILRALRPGFHHWQAPNTHGTISLDSPRIVLSWAPDFQILTLGWTFDFRFSNPN